MSIKSRHIPPTGAASNDFTQGCSVARDPDQQKGSTWEATGSWQGVIRLTTLAAGAPASSGSTSMLVGAFCAAARREAAAEPAAGSPLEAVPALA